MDWVFHLGGTIASRHEFAAGRTRPAAHDGFQAPLPSGRGWPGPRRADNPHAGPKAWRLFRRRVADDPPRRSRYPASAGNSGWCVFRRIQRSWTPRSCEKRFRTHYRAARRLPLGDARLTRPVRSCRVRRPMLAGRPVAVTWCYTATIVRPCAARGRILDSVAQRAGREFFDAASSPPSSGRQTQWAGKGPSGRWCPRRRRTSVDDVGCHLWVYGVCRLWVDVADAPWR
jgi:hypothetical protein